MKFYKLTSAYKYDASQASDKTTRTKSYRFYYRSWDNLMVQLQYEVGLGAKCSVQEISEAAYIKATGIRD